MILTSRYYFLQNSSTKCSASWSHSISRNEQLYSSNNEKEKSSEGAGDRLLTRDFNYGPNFPPGRPSPTPPNRFSGDWPQKTQGLSRALRWAPSPKKIEIYAWGHPRVIPQTTSPVESSNLKFWDVRGRSQAWGSSSVEPATCACAWTTRDNSAWTRRKVFRIAVISPANACNLSSVFD